MTHPTKALAFGTAALLAAALNGDLRAQVGEAPRAGQPAAAVAAAPAIDDQHHTRQLIGHALGMAANAADLQLVAQAEGRQRQGQGQGERQDRNRNADNRNAADRNDNDRNDNNRNDNNANRRDDNNRNDNNANRRDDNDNNANAANRRNDNDGDQRERYQQAHRQAIQQLRQLAYRQFESSNQLLRTAEANLNAQGQNAAAVAAAANDPRAWTRRLHSAADQYASTLRSLARVGSRAPEMSAAGDDQNQNQNDRDRNRDQANNRNDDNADNRANANRGWLNRTEAAQVVLLNQAVRQAVEAYELNQAHHHAFGINRAGADNASAQRLQEHARQMGAESQQIVQQVLASLNAQGDRDQDRDRRNDRDRQGEGDRQNDRNDQGQRNANANDNAGNRGDNNDQQQQGQASVQQLARQAQQVVETLQRINPASAAGAPAAAPAGAGVGAPAAATPAGGAIR